MYNDEPQARRFYAVSYPDDDATISLGMLIPKPPTGDARGLSFTPDQVVKKIASTVPLHQSPYVNIKVVTVLVAGAVLALVSVLGTPYLRAGSGALMAQLFVANDVAASPVIVQNPYTGAMTPLNYGVQMTFTEPSFFTTTREAFITDAKSFLEVDLTTMQLRYFDAGVLREQMPILMKGKIGSWWETPAGLYQIANKSKSTRSSFAQMSTPWTVNFSGNFSIHGIPVLTDNSVPVAEYDGGCIRLADADAEKIYNLVTVATPVLVQTPAVTPDAFVYEPKVPELGDLNYLIADVESSTVLAGSELSTEASIASLTKLMTALVASENINLDTTVSVMAPSFVQSLIPRLQDRGKVSMYSLLQLLLVESSNEAAEVIAAQIGRTQFIAKMNEKAVSLGLSHTHFADPSGLSSENKSSLRDLLGLVRYIYNSRQFIFEITANQKLETAYVSGEFGTLQNFNHVEGMDNFLGGKVGETTAAGQTSISLHTLNVKGENRVIAIILLGSDSRNADVRELLSYAKERFE